MPPQFPLLLLLFPMSRRVPIILASDASKSRRVRPDASNSVMPAAPKLSASELRNGSSDLPSRSNTGSSSDLGPEPVSLPNSPLLGPVSSSGFATSKKPHSHSTTNIPKLLNSNSSSASEPSRPLSESVNTYTSFNTSRSSLGLEPLSESGQEKGRSDSIASIHLQK